MLCSTPRMIFLSQMNEMCDIFIMCFVLCGGGGGGTGGGGGGGGL